MSPTNQLELQKALRDNSEDTKNSFRDLNNWEQDIKKKELKIKNSREESEVRKSIIHFVKQVIVFIYKQLWFFK